MKVKSVVKIAEVNYYVQTDQEDFPRYRRSEQGSWERRMLDSWESWDASEDLEKEFQEYQAGQPQPKPGELAKLFHPLPGLPDGVYHMEYVDDHHVRLTRTENL